MNGWTNDTEVGNYLIKNVSEEAFQDFLDCLSDQPDLSDCPSAKHEYIRLTNNVLKEYDAKIRVTDVQVCDCDDDLYKWLVMEADIVEVNEQVI
jgi:hypothetical protein